MPYGFVNFFAIKKVVMIDSAFFIGQTICQIYYNIAKWFPAKFAFLSFATTMAPQLVKIHNR